MENEDVTNYESPRAKRKRVGPWWEGRDSEGPFLVTKKRQLERNYDSGVYMISDPDTPSEHEDRVEDETRRMDWVQGSFFKFLVNGVHKNMMNYIYEKGDLEDRDLEHIQLLNQVIQTSVDPGTEVPAEGQFRSLIPELVVMLERNSFRHLHSNLFHIEHLTFLSLRYNQIEELPSQISNLRNLRTLDLSHNRLAWLPHSLQSLHKPFGELERLDTLGNPLLRKSGHALPTQNRSLVSCTSVTYFDESRQLIQGSPPPISRDSTDLEYISFSPPSTPALPSLFSLALKKAVQEESPEVIRSLCGEGDLPLPLERGLEQAEENLRKEHSPLQKCRCGREFVVARAEWVEFWCDLQGELLPFKSQVCSWNCAGAFHVKA
jgi:hypothetical protein